MAKLGEWIKVNDEAIYGSKAWIKTGEEKEYHLERIDKKIDFNWVRNTPGKPVSEDNFNVTWTGFLQPPKSDIYTFEAVADDGVRLWIDDNLIIDQWQDEKAAVEGNVMGKKEVPAQDGKINLKAGIKYPVKIKYYEKRQQAVMRLFWSASEIQKQIIPGNNLFSSKDKKYGDGLKVKYRSMGQYINYTVNNGSLYVFNLEWPGKELAIKIDRPAINSKVTLLGRSEVLTWRYKNDTLLIDTSEINYNEMPCEHAWVFKIEDYILSEKE